VTVICSLLGYNYVALGFPGAASITQTLGTLAPGVVGVATGMAAWGCWHAWAGVERKRAQQS
jgi:hypothetical protein